MAIINKALEVSLPFTSCLMTNSNASKRLPFPVSTICFCFAVSFYLYTADRCDGYSPSPHQYIPSTVLSPQEICSLAQLLHNNVKCREVQQSKPSCTHIIHFNPQIPTYNYALCKPTYKFQYSLSSLEKNQNLS